jgi:hypothetical protein
MSNVGTPAAPATEVHARSRPRRYAIPVQLRQEHVDVLRQLAGSRDVSLALLVREAVTEYLTRRKLLPAQEVRDGR